MTIPLVCVAGTLCDRRLYGPMLDALGRDADVRSVEHASVEAAADAVLADAPPRFVAAGFSLGGFVALALARRAPRRVAGLALFSSNARADAPAAALARRAQVELLRSEGADAVVDGMWPGCVSPSNENRRDVLATLRVMAADTSPDRHAAQMELAIGRPDARGPLAAAAMPVIAIHGADDAMCPLDRAAEIAHFAPRGALAIVPDAGHFAPLERADEVAHSLASWLELEGLA